MGLCENVQNDAEDQGTSFLGQYQNIFNVSYSFLKFELIFSGTLTKKNFHLTIYSTKKCFCLRFNLASFEKVIRFQT